MARSLWLVTAVMLAAASAAAQSPSGLYANPARHECCGLAVLIGAIILGVVLCLLFRVRIAPVRYFPERQQRINLLAVVILAVVVYYLVDALRR